MTTPDQLAFTTANRRTEAIAFTLDGDEYHFTPPKWAAFVMPALDGGGDESTVLKAMMDWVGAGLPDDEEAKIESRLRDPKDPLDVTDLFAIFQALAAKAAGRPTPASSGS